MNGRLSSLATLFADDFLGAVLSVLLKKNLCASKWRLILETPLRGERVLDKERALQCRFCPRQNVVISPDLDMAKSAAFHSDNAAPCENLASWFKGLVIVSDRRVVDHRDYSQETGSSSATTASYHHVRNEPSSLPT